VTGAVALPPAHVTVVVYVPAGVAALVCTIQVALPELFVIFGPRLGANGMWTTIEQFVNGAVCTRAVN
jgi:hypothetical protein